MRKRKNETRPAANPPTRPTAPDAYKDLLQTLRALDADQRVVDAAEAVVREREEKRSAAAG